LPKKDRFEKTMMSDHRQCPQKSKSDKMLALNFQFFMIAKEGTPFENL
jgi:hypothetical protein